jgi:tape measure domain-containing protein
VPDFAVKTAFTAVDKVSPAFNRMSGAADRFGKKTSGMLAGLAGTFGVIGGIALVGMGLKKVVDSARMLEDAEAAFTPLMGGAEKAKELVSALNKAAAATPFEFEDIAKSAKQLLPVMNQDIEKTIKTFNMLGDTAGGNADKLESITRGYTKAMMKGKVDLESLYMIADAGVPIFDELAKTMGYSKDEMNKLFKDISAGKVTSEDLTKTFENMTSKGGIFFQGMITSSKTTSGVFSTLADSVTLTAASIGQELLPYIKDLALWLTDAMERVKTFTTENKNLIGFLIESIPWVVGALVAWKVATWAVQAAQWALKIPLMINIGLTWGAQAALWALESATWAAQAATWALNIAMAANPIAKIVMIIIAAVTALAGVAYLVYKNWIPVKTFFSDLWNGIVNSFNAAIDYMSNKLDQFGNWAIGKWQAVKGFFGFGEGDVNVNNAPNKVEAEGKYNNNTTVNINNKNVESKVTTNNKRDTKIKGDLGTN